MATPDPRQDNADRQEAQQVDKGQQDKLKKEQDDSVKRQANLGKPYGSNS